MPDTRIENPIRSDSSLVGENYLCGLQDTTVIARDHLSGRGVGRHLELVPRTSSERLTAPVRRIASLKPDAADKLRK